MALSRSVTFLLAIFTPYAFDTVEVTPEESTMPKSVEDKVNDLWLQLLHPLPFKNENEEETYAICVLKPSTKLEPGKPVITGQVVFKQGYPNKNLEAIFNVDGFPATNDQPKRAIHIHQFGDLSDGCDSAGGHFNPFGVNHPNHPGDFGNFSPKDGKIIKHKKNMKATLFGLYSILGRSIVIHEKEDDLGKGNNRESLLHGNAGKRLACCVIGISSKDKWQTNAAACH